MSNPNSVETDMKQIREFRDVHETAETNAFIEEMERLAKEKAANNRSSLKLENERNVHTRHEKKKDEDKDKAMEAKKNFEKEQEKMLEPSFEKQLMEEEGEAQPEKPAIDEDEWKRRVNEDLVESFSIFDIDGDGEISISELMSVMASVGNDISAEDAEDIFDVVDSNGDGKISFDEFKECMYEKMSQQTVDEDLIGAFEIFDEDKDGYISPTEIQLLFKKLGELISTDEAVEIMKDCDLNKDGLIDFEEFKAFYLKIFENQPTLAEQLVAEAEADEKQKVALAMEEKEASGYPQGEAPSPTDYK